MENLLKLVPFFLFLCLVCVKTIDGVSVQEDLTLTLPEKMTLEKFKKRVVPILPHSYMKEDIYLIRWLRARNFNLEMAEKMLKSNLRWRREHKIDTINEEDWSDMKMEYPYTSDKVDKEGRPIGAANLGAWNIRRIALAGKMPRLQRYLTKLLEEGCQLVVQQQRKGLNVTQFKVLLNLEGFNQIQHACPICLPVYTSFVANYEERYPGMVDKAIHVNTPPVYDIVLNLVRPLFSPATRKAVIIFGQDKAEWMNFLDKEISRDQRPFELGGTSKD